MRDKEFTDGVSFVFLCCVKHMLNHTIYVQMQNLIYVHVKQCINYLVEQGCAFPIHGCGRGYAETCSCPRIPYLHHVRIGGGAMYMVVAW
jgi:hypothetical protein